MINLLGAPGAILLGLGFYGVFAVQGDAFIPLLNDIRVAYAAIAVGAAITAAEFLVFIRLVIRKSENLKNPDRH